MIRGIDYAWARPQPVQIKAQGYQFCCRYLSQDSGKSISPPEAQALRDAELAIVLVWETTAARALDGYSAGAEDARSAYAQARAVGQPLDRPIYFAADFDASPQQQAAIDDYLRGAASALGTQRVGIYGSYYVCQRCQAAGTARWYWQTLAWSGGQQFPGHIYQDGGQDFAGGADTNIALAADYGQWPYQQEDDVTPEQMQQILSAVAGTKRQALSEVYIPMVDGGYIGTCSLPIWVDDKTFADYIIAFNTSGVSVDVNLMDAGRNIVQTKTAPINGMVVFDGLDEMEESHIEASMPVVVVHRTTQK